MLNEFINAGHCVTLITTWFPPEEEYTQNENLTIIRLKSKRKYSFQSNPIEMADWMFKAIRYVKEHNELKNNDITLTNFSFPGGPVALTLKRLYNIPFVLLSHSHDIPWYYPKKMFFWHLLLYYPIKFICKQSSHNVVLSEEMKLVIDRFVGKKYSNKNSVINNGLHTENFKKKFKGDTLKIVFVGRLVPQKSPYVFLNSIKELAIYDFPFEVIILGDGKLREKMEEWILLNGISNVEFKGKVSHLEVFNELDKAYLLISTSQNEGMSLAILEAISTGVYVIATPASGNQNIIIENVNGNIVPFDNYKIIAQKMYEFYNDKLVYGYEYPADYIENMEQKFAWKNIAKEYLNLLYKYCNK